jgi:DNA-binding transcriptional LysR family regulator
MDQLKTMETFVQVVRTRSFSVAARELGFSRALVTKHVQSLEEHLGARLLNRTTRSINLTEIGAEYYDFCRRILAEIGEEARSLQDLQKEPRGSLRILAPKSFGTLHLCETIAAFGQRYPEIRTTLVLDDSSVRGPDLVENAFDVAVRLAAISDSSLIVRKLASLRWVVVAAPAYLARRPAPKTPDDLAEHNCLTHLTIGADRLWRFQEGRKSTAVKVQGSFAANSVIALQHAARVGIGITALPTYCIAEDLASGALTQLLPSYTMPDRPLYVVYPYGTLPTKKVRLFVEFLADWFKQPPWERGVRQRRPADAGLRA